VLKGQSGAHASSITVNTADLPGPNGPTFSDNEDGQLIGPGRTEDGAGAILALLRDVGQHPVADADLEPDDPLVNIATGSAYHRMKPRDERSAPGVSVVHRFEDRDRRPSVEGGIV
jgi:hypothetical protein